MKLKQRVNKSYIDYLLVKYVKSIGVETRPLDDRKEGKRI